MYILKISQRMLLANGQSLLSLSAVGTSLWHLMIHSIDSIEGFASLAHSALLRQQPGLHSPAYSQVKSVK